MQKNKNGKSWAAVSVCAALLLAGCQSVYRPGERKILSVTEEPIVIFDEIERLSPDNSKAKLLQTREIVRVDSKVSAEMITSGQDLENKIAIKLNANEMVKLAKAVNLNLFVHYNTESEQSPNKFFIGLADTTDGGFIWKDGLFANEEPQRLENGWSSIRFEKTDVLSFLSLSRQYTLYISCWREAGGDKVPISTKIYFDRLTGSIPVFGKNSTSVNNDTNSEFQSLLALSDDELLNDIEKRTFRFLIDNTSLETGLTVDRYTNQKLASIASSGFLLSSLPVGVERGWIGREEAEKIALTALRAYTSGFVAGHKGFFYHFVDRESGERALNSELSSIDTGLLIAGAITAREYFKTSEITKEVETLYNAAEWDWMLGGGRTFVMGWNPENGFLEARWDHFNEGILLYFLAVGAKKNAVSPESWDLIKRPLPEGTYIAERKATTLFMFQYPLIWLDIKNLQDDYADYFNNLRVVSEQQILFAFKNQGLYKSFRYGIWGVSASDGPNGYRAYATGEGDHDGTIAPYASIASLPVTPKASMRSIRSMLNVYRSYVYRKYGFVSAFNVGRDWFSDDYIGIDQGSLLLMIENYRSGLIWNLMNQAPEIQSALNRMGFRGNTLKQRVVSPEFLKAAGRRGGYMIREDERPVYTMNQKKGALVIDGKIGEAEWTGARKVSFSQEDSLTFGKHLDGAELRADVRGLYDEEALYVAVDVTDSVVIHQLTDKSTSDFYRSDSLEIYLSSKLKGHPETVKSLKLAVLAGGRSGKSRAIRFGDSRPGTLDKVGRGIEFSVFPKEEGYSVEVKIPFKILGRNIRKGSKMAFDVVVHNGNNAEAPDDSYARENVIAFSHFAEPWLDIEKWSIAELK